MESECTVRRQRVKHGTALDEAPLLYLLIKSASY